MGADRPHPHSPFSAAVPLGKDDIRHLFDSIFRGYPIGNLLM
jgi:hypothetical protein